MGQALSKLNQNQKFSALLGGGQASSLALGTVMASAIVYIVYTKGKELTAEKDDDSPFHVSAKKTSKETKQEKVAVDMVFFRRLWQLLKVLIPGKITHTAHVVI